jgi:hypothetical protein
MKRIIFTAVVVFAVRLMFSQSFDSRDASGKITWQSGAGSRLITVTNVATLTNACRTALNGDTILMTAGTYDLSGYAASKVLGTNTLTILKDKTNVTLMAIEKAIMYTTNTGNVLQIENCTGIRVAGIQFESIRQSEPINGNAPLWNAIELWNTNVDLIFEGLTFKNWSDHGICYLGGLGYASNVVCRNITAINVGSTNWTAPITWADGAVIVPEGPNWTVDGLTAIDCNRGVEIFSVSTDGFADYGTLKIINSTFLRQKSEAITFQSVHPLMRTLIANNVFIPLGNQASQQSAISGSTISLTNISIIGNLFNGNSGNAFGNSIGIGLNSGASIYGSGWEIVGNTFRNLQYGISAFNLRNCSIRDNHFEDLWVLGLDVNGVNITAENNTFVNSTVGDFGTPAMRLVNVGGIPSTNVVFRNNSISGSSPSGRGIGIQANNTQCEVSGNHFLNCNDPVRFDLGASNNVCFNNIARFYAGQTVADLNPVGHNLIGPNIATNGLFYGTNDTLANRISGTIAGVGSYRSNAIGPVSFTFPATTVNWTNPINANIEVYIDNSGVTGTAIKKNGTQLFSSLVGDVTIGLQPGEYLSATYSVGTPTARWSPQ